MVEHLIALVERDSYLEFLRSDLRDLFARSGISIAEERSALLGSARIVVGGGPPRSLHSDLVGAVARRWSDRRPTEPTAHCADLPQPLACAELIQTRSADAHTHGPIATRGFVQGTDEALSDAPNA